MSCLELIDLHFGSAPQAIGVYLVDTDDGPALFDCGPASTLDALEAGLAEHGLALTDVKHLLLSHIHLDHAGAAGSLVRPSPGLTGWGSPIGRAHLIDPSRLPPAPRRPLGGEVRAPWGGAPPRPGKDR